MGIYEFELHVGLEEYETVPELVLPFTVTIGDCEVTSFEAPSGRDAEKTYEITDSKASISYSMA
jgi:hypothetical protein